MGFYFGMTRVQLYIRTIVLQCQSTRVEAVLYHLLGNKFINVELSRTELETLRLLFLDGIIENQNSDFVMT
jgi:hypothetical protein